MAKKKTVQEKIEEKEKVIEACKKRIAEEQAKLERYNAELTTLRYNEVQHLLTENDMSVEDLKTLLNKPAMERRDFVQQQENTSIHTS
jgi:hypothetical protein